MEQQLLTITNNVATKVTSVTGGTGITVTGTATDPIINGASDPRPYIEQSRVLRLRNNNSANVNIAWQPSDYSFNWSVVSGDSQNCLALIPSLRSVFPIQTQEAIAENTTKNGFCCAWRVNGTPSAVNGQLRFCLASEQYLTNRYGELVTGSSNADGLYSAVTADINVIALRFDVAGARIHQGSVPGVLSSQNWGANYASTFTDGDIVVISSSFGNPPFVNLESYTLSGTVLTTKSSHICNLTSANVVGVDALVSYIPYINAQITAQNFNTLGERWYTTQVTSVVNNIGKPAYTDLVNKRWFYV